MAEIKTQLSLQDILNRWHDTYFSDYKTKGYPIFCTHSTVMTGITETRLKGGKWINHVRELCKDGHGVEILLYYLKVKPDAIPHQWKEEKALCEVLEAAAHMDIGELKANSVLIRGRGLSFEQGFLAHAKQKQKFITALQSSAAPSAPPAPGVVK